MDVKNSLSYAIDGKIYRFGELLSYSESYSKSVSTTPIVSLSYKDAFAVETSSQIICTLKFVRVQPRYCDNTSDSSALWSNEFWYEAITRLMDRWQAKTDGGMLIYHPSFDNPYLPKIEYNGYIKSISRTYTEGKNTEIFCNMEFHVGKMYVNQSKQIPNENSIQPKPKEEFSLLMSNSRLSAWYPLMGKIMNADGSVSEIDCVKEYSLVGGAEEPFEHIRLVIPKDRLNSIAPELSESKNIVAGQNKILLDAVGKSTMYVSKFSTRGNDVILEAYCDAAVLIDKYIPITSSNTPFGWISSILCSGKYGVAFRPGDTTNRGTFIYSYFPKEGVEDYIRFEEGTDTWMILQICATYLGCRIFFSNDNAYLIDYRINKNESNRVSSANPGPVNNQEYAEIDLHSHDPKNPLYMRVVGTPEINDDDIGSITNVQRIKCLGYNKDKEFGSMEFPFRHQRSVDTFGEISGNTIYTPGLVQGTDPKGRSYNQAFNFAKSYLDYRAEPQQSISFTLKEIQKNSSGTIEWAPFFEPTAACGTIRSSVNETVVSDLCTLKDAGDAEHIPQKLILSSYERKYPQGITTYVFGQIAPMDLSSSTSQINSNLNNN